MRVGQCGCDACFLFLILQPGLTRIQFASPLINFTSSCTMMYSDMEKYSGFVGSLLNDFASLFTRFFFFVC